MAAASPSGPGTSQTNESSVAGWDNTGAVDGSWQDSKNGNDPCPAGFRVPSRSQWEAVLDYNPDFRAGTPKSEVE